MGDMEPSSQVSRILTGGDTGNYSRSVWGTWNSPVNVVDVEELQYIHVNRRQSMLTGGETGNWDSVGV